MKTKINNYINITILLVLAILIVLSLFLIGTMYLSTYYNQIRYIVLSLVLLTLIYIIVLNVILVYSYKNDSIKRWLYRPLSDFTKIIYPLLSSTAKLFNKDRSELKGIFIDINNILTKSLDNKYEPEDVLLLTPHCLQNSSCKVKITNSTENCIKCGQCQIKDLLTISETYNNKFIVVSGGTSARKVVADINPKYIISVACENDLLSGIQDVRGIPVMGIINSRPNGPCVNTSVDIKKVESALKNVIKRTKNNT